MNLDPLNTTAADGAACGFCGDDAVTVVTIDHTPTPVCADCTHDRITDCPACGQTIAQDQGVRLYGTADLYCLSCAAAHPALIEGREREARWDTERGK